MWIFGHIVCNKETGNCMSVGLGIISCWVGEWGLRFTVTVVNY